MTVYQRNPAVGARLLGAVVLVDRVVEPLQRRAIGGEIAALLRLARRADCRVDVLERGGLSRRQRNGPARRRRDGRSSRRRGRGQPIRRWRVARRTGGGGPPRGGGAPPRA